VQASFGMLILPPVVSIASASAAKSSSGMPREQRRQEGYTCSTAPGNRTARTKIASSRRGAAHHWRGAVGYRDVDRASSLLGWCGCAPTRRRVGRQAGEIRQRGFCVSLGERDPDIGAAAVPVIDRAGANTRRVVGIGAKPNAWAAVLPPSD
jgi:hypothetical protein